MTVIIVDDENLTLRMMTKTVEEVLPEAEIHSFQRVKAAIEFAEGTDISIAFLDIQMRGMTGTELAAKLSMLQPHMNIIFCTAYDEYKGAAMDLHASGYLMKPVQAEDIRRELALLRYPIGTAGPCDDKLHIRCFGVFQALYHGKPLPFAYQKTNELLAVLIDKKGAFCSLASLETIMWDDDTSHMSYLKRLRADLLAAAEKLGLNSLILSQRGKIGLNTDLIDCDYFDYLAGKPDAISAYQGVYMEQYSWAEVTNSALYWNSRTANYRSESAL